MPDNYPRRTLDAIVAYVGGLLSVGAIALAVFTTINATTVNSTTASTTQLIVGQGATMTKLLSTTFTVNPDSMAAGGSTSTNVTLTGAAVGDTCSVTFTAGDIIGTTSTIAGPFCRITATNIGTVYLYNATGTSAFNAGNSSGLLEARRYQ